MVAWSILLVLQGILPVATVYVSKWLVDSLVAALGTGSTWQQVRPTLALAGLMVAIMLLGEVLQSIGEWVRTAQAQFIQDHISGLVHAQSTTVDLAFYETPEYHDHLYRARDDASYRPLALLENGGNFLQNSLTLLAMATILLPYGWWLPLVLVASALPAVYVVLRFDWRSHQWWKRTTPDRRWTQYYDWMMVDGTAAAELRLFGLGPHFRSTYQLLRRRLRTEQLHIIKAQSLARLGASVLALVLSGAAIAWMLWQALRGSVTLGEVALFYQAFSRGQSLMRSLLSNVGEIYRNSLFLSSLFQFLDLTPHVADPPHPVAPPVVLRQGIRFRDVRFRYPGSERTALQGFNLVLPAGKIVAIVGTNGAGKSTLVKLLCRLYDPEEGSVELDGIDIRCFSVADLRNLITVLFQIPVTYHATAGENIAMSNIARAPEAQNIASAAERAGAHDVIKSLPHGYDTLLGKWFVDGTELSGGEWQRIALARAFLRQAPIMVLDEPTSSMDSWAEADWFERLRTLAKDRTTMLITHRFTIAMRADIIHVMHHGQIVESGSHADLLAQGGRYAQSWHAQMQASADAAAPMSHEQTL